MPDYQDELDQLREQGTPPEGTVAFASVEDVAVRVQRDLAESEQALVQLVIDGVTGLIAEAAGEDLEWASTLDPVPTTFTLLCIEKAVAVSANPSMLEAASEQLGAYQRSETYRTDGAGGAVFLSDDERKQVRRAIKVSSFRSQTMVSPYSGDDDDSVDMDFDLGS